MIDPPPARCIAGITAFVPRNTPVEFTSMIRFHNSNDMSVSATPVMTPLA